MSPATAVSVSLGVVALLASLFLWMFGTVISEMGRLESRVQSAEQVMHTHKPDGRPVYPPDWRPR